MFYDNELWLLQKMLKKCHLSTEIINPEENTDSKINNIYTVLAGPDKTFYDYFPQTRERTVYRFTDIFLCCYIFFVLPYQNNNKRVFVIGPYLNIDITHQQILEQGENFGISPKDLNQLEMFYSALPIIREENLIFAMVDSFAEFLWNGDFENIDIEFDNPISFMQTNITHKSVAESNELNIQMLEKRYDFENELMSAVSHGAVHKAEIMLSSFSSLAFENRSSDRLRSLKNYCIIMNTLCRKAAENGGVHPYYLNKVSSDFAKRIENLNSLNLTQVFMLELIKTYCQLVRHHSVKNLSPLIKKIIIKIESDLSGNLTLKELAAANNVSASYLSGLFKKENGVTLTEYVNSKRVQHAKHLLKNTNLQIQTIAQHCGILDLHYFCRIFKKATGKTPSEYRTNLSID